MCSQKKKKCWAKSYTVRQSTAPNVSYYPATSKGVRLASTDGTATRTSISKCTLSLAHSIALFFFDSENQNSFCISIMYMPPHPCLKSHSIPRVLGSVGLISSGEGALVKIYPWDVVENILTNSYGGFVNGHAGLLGGDEPVLSSGERALVNLYSTSVRHRLTYTHKFAWAWLLCGFTWFELCLLSSGEQALVNLYIHKTSLNIYSRMILIMMLGLGRLAVLRVYLVWILGSFK